MSAEPVEGQTTSALAFVGPFESHAVVLNGWQVPHLKATPMNGGLVHLNLDDRFGLDLSIGDAEVIVPFIADCIAVAAGFTCHPGRDGVVEPLSATPYHRMHSVGWTSTD